LEVDASTNMQPAAHWFESSSGASQLASGMFRGPVFRKITVPTLFPNWR
jgi:hypothetical protein